MGWQGFAVGLLLAVLGGACAPGDGERIGSSSGRLDEEAPAERDVVFVLEAGASEGRDCRPLRFVPTGPEDWECPGSPAHFGQQLEGLRKAIGRHVPADGTFAVSVWLSTLGQRHFEAGQESVTGPVWALPRRRIRTPEDKALLLEDIAAITLPTVRDEPPYYRNCGPAHPDGTCQAPSHPIWALHEAAAGFRSGPERARHREVCVAVGRQDPIFPALPYAPEVPEAVGSTWRAAVEDLASAEVDRLTAVALQAEPPLFPTTSAVVRFAGEAVASGVVSVRVRGRSNLAGTLSEPFDFTEAVVVHEGYDRDHVAWSVAEFVSARIAADPILSRALLRAEWAPGGLVALRYRPDAAQPVLPFADPLLVEVATPAGVGAAVSLVERDPSTGLVVRSAPDTHAIAIGAFASFEGRRRVALLEDRSEWQQGFARCLLPDIEMVGIEVNQAIQSWEHGVPLVAGKDAVARVHLQVSEEDRSRVEDEGEPPPHVEGRLRAFRCPGEAPADCLPAPEDELVPARSPPSVPRPAARTVSRRVDRRARQRGDGLWFHVPPAWREGHVALRADLPGVPVSCAEPSERAFREAGLVPGPDCSVRLTFLPPVDVEGDGSPERITIAPYLVTDDTDGDPVTETSLARFFLDEALPLSFRPGPLQGARWEDVRTVRVVTDSRGRRDVKYADKAWDSLRRLRDSQCTASNCTAHVVYGVVANDARLEVNERRIEGAGTNGVALARGTDSEEPTAGEVSVVLHEVLHAFGRTHVPYCMTTQHATRCAEEPYPYDVAVTGASDPAGWLHRHRRPLLGPASPDAAEVWGLRGFLEILDARSHFDLMSYCAADQRWVSAFQYDRLLRPGPALPDGSARWGDTLRVFLEEPSCARFDVAPGPDCPSPRSCETPLVFEGTRSIWLSGLMNVAAGPEIDLAPLREVDRPGEVLPLETTPWRVRLEDDAGTTLFESGLPVDSLEADPAGDSLHYFNAFVPVTPGATRLVIAQVMSPPVDVHAVDASPSPPTVAFLAPGAGDVLSGDAVTLSWTGSDPDGDTLFYQVEQSSDGIDWRIVAFDLTETTLTVPLREVPGSTSTFFRVSASDGFHSAEALAGPVTAPLQHPRIQLLEPSPGAVFRGAAGLSLRAFASDTEDGGHASGLYEWISDRDGLVHTGPTGLIGAESLSEGAHTLTVLVTDTDGLTGSASVPIVVERERRVPGPDLSVRVSAEPSVVVGSALTTQVRLLNVGTEPATGPFELVYTPDEGIEVAGAVGDGFSCSVAGGAARCVYAGPDVPPRSQVDVRLTLTASDLGRGSYDTVNVAELSYAADVGARNDRIEDWLHVTALQVDVSGPARVLPGTIGSYEIRVTNVGSVPHSTPFDIAHVFPAGHEVVSWSGEGWDCFPTGGPRFECRRRSGEVPAGGALPAIEVEVRSEAAFAESSVRLDVVEPEAPGPGALAELVVTAHNEGTASHTAPVRFARELPMELVPERAGGEGWRCGLSGQLVSCEHFETIEAGASSEPLSIRVRGAAPSDLVIDVDEPVLVAGSEAVYVVRARNDGAGTHRAPATFVATFPEDQDVVGTEGEAWRCLLEDRSVRCGSVQGVIDPGESLPELRVRVFVRPTDSALSDVVVETTVPVLDGDVRRLSALVRNQGTVDAPGPISIAVDLPGDFVDAAGEGWMCVTMGLVLECTHEASRLAAGASLPPLAITVSADPVVEGDPPPGDVRRLVITTTSMLVIPFSTSAQLTVVPLYAEPGTGPYEFELTLTYGMRVVGDGWSCTSRTEVPPGQQTVTCRHAGETLSVAELPRPTVYVDLSEDLREELLLTPGVDLEVVGGDPCLFDVPAFRRSLVAGRLAEPAASCTGSGGFLLPPEQRFQIHVSDWLGDGEPVLPELAAPNHNLVQWETPHQGGVWQYFVGVRNMGTDATGEDTTVRFRVPPGMRWSPEIARTGISSVARPGNPFLSSEWSCTEDGRDVVCALGRGLDRKERVALRILLTVYRHAHAEQPVLVTVSNADDVDDSNDTFSDAIDPVAQRFGPTFLEQFDPNPEEDLLEVLVDASTSWTVDDLETCTFTVTNTAGSAATGDQVMLRGLGAPALVHVQDVTATGWTCDGAWGRVDCAFEPAGGSIAPGASLPPVTVTFVPAPQQGTTELVASVHRPGYTTAGAVRRTVAVAPSLRPDLGLLAISACPPFDDCWPVNDPATSVDPGHLARIHLLETDGSGSREVLFYRDRRRDERLEPDLFAFWEPGGGGLLAGRHFMALDDVVAATDIVRPTRPLRTFGPVSPDGLVVESGGDWLRVQGLTSSTVQDLLRPSDPLRTRRPENDIFDPVWSAAGDRIVFRRGVPPKLWIVDVTVSGTGTPTVVAGAPRRLTNDDSDRAEHDPAFAPDGSEVALSADGRIVAVDPDSGSERVVTDGGGDGDADTHPTWSPDGAYIAFQRGEASRPPLDYRPSGGGLPGRVRSHRELIQGRFPPYRDSGIFVAPSAGGDPVLLARGRHPAWRPAVAPVEPPPELEPPAPHGGAAEVRIDFPAEGTSVVPGPLSLRGAVSADAPITSDVRVLYLVDHHDGRGVNRRLPGEYDRTLASASRWDARGLPFDWADPPSAIVPAACAGMAPGFDLMDCQVHALTSSLRPVPGAQVGMVRFGNTLLEGNAFVHTFLDGSTLVPPSFDGDGDAVPDVEETVQEIRFGFCGATGTPACRSGLIGDTSDSFDGAIRTMNHALGAMPAGGSRVAYLISAGRDRVTTHAAGPLAGAVEQGVRIHTFVRGVEPMRSDIVWVVDRDLDAAQTDVLEAALADFAARLPAALDTHVALVGPTDLLAAHLGETSYEYVDAEWTDRDSRSLTGLLREAAAGRLGLRPGARTHVVVVSPEGRREGLRASMDDLDRTFPNGAIVHAIAPEGAPGRPLPSACEHLPHPNGAGNRYYDVADMTGGSKVSLCSSSFGFTVDRILADIAREPVDDCSDPESPLFRIARLSGGSCRVLDGSERSARAPMPWGPSPVGPGLSHLELRVNGGSAETVAVDDTGLWEAELSAVPPGPSTITVTAVTTDGRSASTDVRVYGNTGPEAVDDHFAGTPFSGSYDVLSNDGDADGDALTLVSHTEATVGVVDCTSDGLCELRYFPSEAPSGTSTFEYTIRDARGGTATATVTVDLPRPPVATPIAIDASSDGTPVSFDLLGAVADPDGDAVEMDPPRQTFGTGSLDCDPSGLCTYRVLGTTSDHELLVRVVDATGLAAFVPVSVTVTDTVADLRGTVSTAGDFIVGEVNGYDISVGNVGSAAAEAVRVRVRLAAGLTATSYAGDGWSCDLGSEVRCHRAGTIAPSDTAPLLRLLVDASTEAVPLARTEVFVDARFQLVETPVRVDGVDLTAVINNPLSLFRNASVPVAVRLDNVGASPTTEAYRVEITLPPDVVFSGSSGDLTCSELSGTVICSSSASIPSGGSLSTDLFLEATSSTADETALAGQVLSPEDAHGDNDAVNVFVVVSGGRILLEFRPVHLAIDEPGSYEIVVHAGELGGPARVEHRVPDEVSFDGFRPGPEWSCVSIDTRTFACDLVSRTFGDAVIAVDVTPSAAAAPLLGVGAMLELQAQLQQGTVTLVITDELPVRIDQDVAVEIVPEPIFVGDRSQYGLALRNAGTAATASPTVLTHTVPAPLTLLGVSAGSELACTTSGSDVTCTRAAGMPGGDSEPITVEARVPREAAPAVEVAAAVTMTGDGNDTNDEASKLLPVFEPTGVDLAIAIAAEPLRVGEPSRYRFEVRHEGTAPTAEDIHVRHAAPADVEVLDATGSGWSCFTFGPSVFCSFSDPVAAGSSLPPIEIEVRATAGAPASVELEAAVETERDLEPGNDVARRIVPVVSGADLAVAVEASPLRVPAPGTYSLLVRNEGIANAAGGVVVTHPVPAGLTPLAVRATGWSCTLGGTVSCSFGVSVGAGDALPPIEVDVQPDPAAVPQVTLEATVEAADDTHAANDRAESVVPVTHPADAAIAVEAPDMVELTPATYALVVENAGGEPSSGLVVVDHTVPADLSLAAVRGGGFECTTSGSDVRCALAAPVAAGSTAPRIELDVIPQIGSAPSVTLTAVVSTEGDLVPGNDTAEQSVAVVPAPDVAPEIVADDMVVLGPATYSLRVRNLGGSAASTVVLEHVVPAELELDEVRATGMRCDTRGRNVTCASSAPIAAGAETGPVEIDVVPTDAAVPSVALRATVAAELDADPSNDEAVTSAAVSTAVDASIAVRAADATLGDLTTYEFVVSNAGSSATSGTVSVAHPVPGGLDVAAVRASGWSCRTDDGDLRCSRSDPLAPGSSYPVIAVSARPEEAAVPSVELTASVAAPFDGRADNDTASETLAVRAPFDLAVAIEATSAVELQPVEYGLLVANPGGVPATGSIELTHPIPPELDVRRLESGGWACSVGRELRCTIAPPVASFSELPRVIVSVVPRSGSAPSVALGATVRSEGDRDAGNDGATSSLPVGAAADLTVAFEPTELTALVPSTYRMVVRNVGGSPTAGPPVVSHIVPAELALLSAGGPGWSCESAGGGLSCTNGALVEAGETLPALSVEVEPSASAVPTVSVEASVVTAFDGDPANDHATAVLPVVLRDADTDTDGDVILDGDDLCPSTVLPDPVPARHLGTNRFADVDGDGVFETTSPRGGGPDRSYTLAATRGCTCAQIIDMLGLGNGHRFYGCSISAMDTWAAFAASEP